MGAEIALGLGISIGAGLAYIGYKLRNRARRRVQQWVEFQFNSRGY